MVDVLYCGKDGGKLHRIDSVKVNPQIAEGGRYDIIVTHSTDALIGSAYCRLSLWNGSALIGESGSIVVRPRESVITKFTGIMPGHDMYLNISLQAELYGFIEECQDGREVYVKLAPPGESTEPIDVETDDDDDDDESISDWLMDNIVLVLMLVLVIILVIKFG